MHVGREPEQRRDEASDHTKEPNLVTKRQWKDGGLWRWSLWRGGRWRWRKMEREKMEREKMEGEKMEQTERENEKEEMEKGKMDRKKMEREKLEKGKMERERMERREWSVVKRSSKETSRGKKHAGSYRQKRQQANHLQQGAKGRALHTKRRRIKRRRMGVPVKDKERMVVMHES